MNEGVSWSGHERHNAYLNLGDGTFAAAGSLLGIDFEDDGRAVVVTDWDGDGDLDLWFRNRTGPQLRLLRNDHRTGHHVTFVLTGRGGNRDAVGARVTVEAGGRRWVRAVMSGDGYLAQSTRHLHFGLGDVTKIDSVQVTWPDGTTRLLASPAIDTAVRVIQGKLDPVVIPPRQTTLGSGPTALPPADGSSRIRLRTPLPLPPSLVSNLPVSGPGRARVLNLWSITCRPCFVELAEWADRAVDLRAGGLDVVAMCIDPKEDRTKADTKYQEIVGKRLGALRHADVATHTRLQVFVQHVRQLVDDQMTLPASFLIDEHNQLQVLYVGHASVDTLLRDHATIASQPAHLRSFRGGRWFLKVPRDFAGLAKTMDALGYLADAAFYRGIK